MKYILKKYTKLDGSFEFSAKFVATTISLFGFKFELTDNLGWWGEKVTNETFQETREDCLDIIDKHYEKWLRSNTKFIEIEYVIK